ncbi:MAG: hypothetical protein PVG99_15805 [Desulfobacteraceae bacterium]|jgi:hypothetical protein
MKKRWVLVFLVFFLLSPAAYAKPTVTCDVQRVGQHELLVTFSWHVTISTDKAWDACDLKISFQDQKGHEVYAVYDLLKLNVGTNTFSGYEICDKEIWKRIKKYVTTLDCIF